MKITVFYYLAAGLIGLAALVGFGWLMWLWPVWVDILALFGLGIIGSFWGGWIAGAYWSQPGSFLGQWRLKRKLHRLGQARELPTRPGGK